MISSLLSEIRSVTVSDVCCLFRREMKMFESLNSANSILLSGDYKLLSRVNQIIFGVFQIDGEEPCFPSRSFLHLSAARCQLCATLRRYCATDLITQRHKS